MASIAARSSSAPAIGHLLASPLGKGAHAASRDHNQPSAKPEPNPGPCLWIRSVGEAAADVVTKPDDASGKTPRRLAPPGPPAPWPKGHCGRDCADVISSGDARLREAIENGSTGKGRIGPRRGGMSCLNP